MDSSCDYLIVGGGVTGLSCANFLKGGDWILCEALTEVGGYCKTIYQDGFVWDYSGHFFHFKTDFVKNMFLSKMENEELYDIKKRTGIIYENERIDFPFQKNIHQLPKQDFIDCLYDLINRPETEPDNFLEMLYCNFGEGITDKFLKPYNEKLYSCDLSDLDLDAMGRFFPYANLKDIVSNFKKASEESYNSTFMYCKLGAYGFIKSLVEDLDEERLLLNHRLVEVDRENKIARFSNGKEISYKFLISSIPFTRLLDGIDDVEYDDNVYTYNKVLVFNLGFDRPSKTNDHWLYFPSKDLVFYRVGFYDNILSDDRMSLYVEIALSVNEEVSEDIMLERVMEDLRVCGIVEDHNLVSHKSVLMDPAYVHIKKESNADFIKRDKQLRASEIYSIGRYGAWKYCSIEDNIVEAYELCNELRGIE